MAEAASTTMAAGEDPAATISANGTVTVSEAAPKAGTPEYAAYVAKMGGKVETTGNGPAMPEGGVVKFFNKQTGAYDWGNHVKELNYRLEQGRAASKGTQKTAEQTAADTAAAAAAEAAKTPEQKAADAAAQAAAQNAGLNWGDLRSKVAATGKIEESDYAALAKANIPREMVDDYMKAISIAQASITNEVIAHAGGQDELNGLIGWAKDNLPQADKDSINSVLRSDQWKVAINDLKARRSAALGGNGEPNLVHGTATNGASGGFDSPEEMTKAINKKDDKGRSLYKNDPEYRKQVQARVIATKDFNPAYGIRY